MKQVLVREDKLTNWFVEWDEEYGQYMIGHYVGGEDTDYEWDGPFDTKEQAQAECDARKEHPPTYKWYRDWEGD